MIAEIKPTISLEEFQKADLRVGTVVSADDLEESNKLIKLMVDIGVERRQIIAGIKKRYKIEDLVGKQVVIIANLPSKNLAGYESQGMLLAATNEEGLPIILMPEGPVQDGAGIK
ncbi:MAG: methionine--tRNA ligase [Candidatus Vogelbacteria bacterium]|nr:methionine--tRNA ligase [Candidatus Vogelbacteria bacterium]